MGKDRLCNATDLLQDCTYGLKHSVSAKEAVQFEILGTKVSRSVFRCLKNLKPGVSEIHASEALTLDGDPLATHPNVNFGDQRVALGIASPTYHNTLAYGELVSVGYGLRGSLVHRSAFYARDISEIPSERRAYIDELVKPYFSSIVCWYEMLHIGTNCGKIWRAVNDCIDMEKYSIKLNPGHLTHTDEWTNSPFSRESSVCIMSGMVLQCDYTASLTNPYLACHEEDGLLIADACLQQKIEELSPACWKRIQRRRKLMTELLNIDLPAEVLPLSDLSGIFFPYLANLQTILVKA